jgi:hypothetical protein
MKVDLKILLNKDNIKRLARPHIWYTTNLKRIPNIDETFELEVDDDTTYCGKIIGVETYKSMNPIREHIYVTIKEFE